MEITSLKVYYRSNRRPATRVYHERMLSLPVFSPPSSASSPSGPGDTGKGRDMRGCARTVPVWQYRRPRTPFSWHSHSPHRGFFCLGSGHVVMVMVVAGVVVVVVVVRVVVAT
jgi:hypothetical protein